MAKRIAIGADHGGFKLKDKIVEVLKKKKNKIADVGTSSDEACDYPEYGFNAAEQVSNGKADRAIVICKSGIGMSMIANKLPGVRAALCGSIKDAESSRQHNDANVLVLAASKVGTKKGVEIVEVWLKTRTLGGRHARRVDQIKKLEKKYLRKRK